MTFQTTWAGAVPAGRWTQACRRCRAHVGVRVELACGGSRSDRCPHELELIWKPFVPDDRIFLHPSPRPLTRGLLYLTTPAAGTLGAFFGRAEVSAEAVTAEGVGSPSRSSSGDARLLWMIGTNAVLRGSWNAPHRSESWSVVGDAVSRSEKRHLNTFRVCFFPRSSNQMTTVPVDGIDLMPGVFRLPLYIVWDSQSQMVAPS
jgi:hypothetical protein